MSENKEIMPGDEVTRVLLVDDNPRTRNRLKANLGRRNYVIEEAANGVSAIRILKQHLSDLDLVILDLVMPDIDGLDVCIWLRAQSDIPIVVVSDHDEEQLVIRALDAGADDYISRPFSIPLLEARIEAIMRRYSHGQSLSSPQPCIEIGDLVIDLAARRVFIDHMDIKLTGTEFALISELAHNLDGIVRHEELLTRVWGPEYRDESQYLYIYFGRIREKMGKKYGALIETVSGRGYMLHATPVT